MRLERMHIHHAKLQRDVMTFTVSVHNIANVSSLLDKLSWHGHSRHFDAARMYLYPHAPRKQGGNLFEEG
jgi:hypothetical protein